MIELKIDVKFTITVDDKLLSNLEDVDQINNFVVQNCFKDYARKLHSIYMGNPSKKVMYKIVIRDQIK